MVVSERDTIHLSKLIELYSTVNHNIHKVEKSFGRSRDPRMECRLGQMNLTALQMYETSSLKGVREKGHDLSNFGNQ